MLIWEQYFPRAKVYSFWKTANLENPLVRREAYTRQMGPLEEFILT